MAGEYFEKYVHDALLPAFQGTLVSSTPVDHPNEFLVAMGDDREPEITLRLKGGLEKPFAAGTPVSFEGVAVAFIADPFMLTHKVETVNRAAVPEKKSTPPPRVNPKVATTESRAMWSLV